MERCGLMLKMSPIIHPKPDGGYEVINGMVDHYMRRYCDYHKDDWYDLLPSAQFVYNYFISDELGISPFEVALEYVRKTPL